VKKLFPTARGRLALLFSALFAACGAVLIAVTYLLVAANLKPADVSTPANDQRFLKTCANLGVNGVPPDANLKQKCAAALSQSATSAAAAQRNEVLSNLLVDSLIALLALTLLSAVLGWVIAGRILRPVHRITEAARAASENNLSARLAMTGPHDELRELGDTFDLMLERLDAAFTSQKRFIANASHELRTPLTLIRTTVDVAIAKKSPTVGDLKIMAEDVRAETEHAQALIETLLTLTRSDQGLSDTTLVDLADIAQSVIDSSDPGLVTLTITAEPTIVRGDPTLLERLVANLVENALRYNTTEGTVRVSVRHESGGDAVLQVENTGPVVPPDQLERLFQPFTRLNDRVGAHGFGLGLPLVESIVAAHDGQVTTVSRAEGGLDIVVTLPGLSA
jgi:signal transduction histidine kinase